MSRWRRRWQARASWTAQCRPALQTTTRPTRCANRDQLPSGWWGDIPDPPLPPPSGCIMSLQAPGAEKESTSQTIGTSSVGALLRHACRSGESAQLQKVKRQLLQSMTKPVWRTAALTREMRCRQLLMRIANTPDCRAMRGRGSSCRCCWRSTWTALRCEGFGYQSVAVGPRTHNLQRVPRPLPLPPASLVGRLCSSVPCGLLPRTMTAGAAPNFRPKCWGFRTIGMFFVTSGRVEGKF